MKYYFIAFSLLMNASVMAMDDDRDASHLPTVQQAASNSPDEGAVSPSCKWVNRIPIPAELRGLTTEEQNKVVIESIMKSVPGLLLFVPK